MHPLGEKCRESHASMSRAPCVSDLVLTALAENDSNALGMVVAPHPPQLISRMREVLGMARYQVRRGPNGTWEAFHEGAAEASFIFDSDADAAEFIRALVATELDASGAAIVEVAAPMISRNLKGTNTE
jgi:hypothetical protein